MPYNSILVTGADGQLGKVVRSLSASYPQFDFIFLSRTDLPIHHFEHVQQYFADVKPAFCINCAAYTAVDKAETDREQAMLINGDATGVLAAAAASFNTKFIHISTDYVFDGTATAPYKEDDATSPVNYYGETKLMGEQLCMQNNADSIVIRTSWVYAEYGNNFVKTMMRLMKERESLNVVSDQVGSPTHAGDLAKAILDIIGAGHQSGEKWVPGIYHYSNEGVISWYDFAMAIKKLTGSNCLIHPIPTTAYPTPAKRPAYSVFNKEKIRSTYSIHIKDWMLSLAPVIARLQS